MAGAGASGSARALVLEDGRGNRAVFTQTEFRITQALADFVAARLLVSLDLQRPGLLFHWSGIGARPEQPEDLITAITLAANALEPVEVRYGHRSISVNERIGQGRENARQFLKDNPETFAKLEVEVRKHLGLTTPSAPPAAAAQAATAVPGASTGARVTTMPSAPPEAAKVPAARR